MDEQTSAEFEALYNAYFNRVFSFLYRLCRDHHTAEELTQETFLQAYISIHRFKGGCEMSTWLISIAKHIFGKYLRKAKKSLGTVELDSLAETMCAASGDGPETAYIRQYDAQAVRNMMAKLPEKYREVLILRTYAELPFAQLARVLDISENSAKVIYFRAKKMLGEGIKNELEL